MSRSAGDGACAPRPLVAAVIVTFNPELPTLRKMIEALQAQEAEIVVVDNASLASVAEQIAKLTGELSCGFEALAQNLGIGAAQNRGFAAVAKMDGNSVSGERYVLFLDHDSIPDVGMVGKLVAADLRLRARGVRVGAVGPAIVDVRTGTTGRFVSSGSFLVKRIPCESGCQELAVDFLISSGTLVRTDTFAKIGGMDEALFIDHVDTEWCLRAKAAGYALFGVCGARLIHSLGDEVVSAWLGRKREVFVHSPLRDYYMCRNTLLILRATRMSLGWRVFLLSRLVGSIVFFVATQAPRLRRMGFMLMGLRDGLLNRQGKWTPPW
ncbi:glycosyltransferase family 2 protein [Paraburkholderia phenoliruptrix]|nr:glycosyltransferase family 2 protein [Paraburkholderia phenoliruptrix]